MAVFTAGGGLNPEQHASIIVWRQELDHILAHIQSGDLYIALRSARQTGKTTLLYQIQTRLHGHGYGVVHLDLSGRSDLSKAQFYQTICIDICEGLGALIDDTNEPTLNPQQVTDQISFSTYLTSLSAHTPQARKLILMLDEVAGVPEQTSATFFPSLRGFFHNGRRPSKVRDLYRKIMFIFAGALDLQRLIQGKSSPLRNVCEPSLFSPLGDFSREQGRRLAGNLQSFSIEMMNAIADAVHEWCDGHPYLTQRLLRLIETSKECRAASVDRLPGVVDRLVGENFLSGDDSNLTHILHYLQARREYSDQIFKILKEERRKSVMHTEDLLSIGLIKRSTDQYLIIRNKIYEEALNIFFTEAERG
jgi:hypothetical protein